MAQNNAAYINSTDYNVVKDRIKDLIAVLDEQTDKLDCSRRLRYTEVDVELERTNGNLLPDELLIAQHIIDSNIRREQSSYIQYVVQSPRAVIMQDRDAPATNTALLERDLTTRVRFKNWQLPMFTLIDGMQSNGFAVMELVQDLNQPGHLAFESVPYGDFGIIMDTKDVQEVEMTARSYYFTRTKLLELADPTKNKNPFDKRETENIIGSESSVTSPSPSVSDSKEKSLFKVLKVTYRINGIVHVAWAAYEKCNDWLRKPLPLNLGFREITVDPLTKQPKVDQTTGLPVTKESYETEYPYFLAPYLISEDDNISHLKGRVYLDQDCQEAVTSITSSYVTAMRRASGLYFSKDTSDPNDDLLMQKNVYFKQGSLINAKVQQFQLTPPSPDTIAAIQMLVTSNQQETSQINFAANNRKDSRKTAREIDASMQSQQQLSTVQVVLFSIFLTQLYGSMFRIIRSRVKAGLIKVDPAVLPFYAGDREYIIKPSGDTDVIEKQQKIQAMQQSWPVIQNTPANVAFLSDMLELMFPDNASKYIQIFQEQQQQSQSQQAQQMQQFMGIAQQMGKGIIELSKHPEYFSEVGSIHALPVVEQAANQVQSMMAASGQNGKPQQVRQ